MVMVIKCVIIWDTLQGMVIYPTKQEKENTLPRTNMAPENRPSQKESTIPTIHFQVLC